MIRQRNKRINLGLSWADRSRRMARETVAGALVVSLAAAGFSVAALMHTTVVKESTSRGAAAPVLAAAGAVGACTTARNGYVAKGTIAAGVYGEDIRARLRLADIDGDGDADYVVVGERGSTRAWLNSGVAAGGTYKYRGLTAQGVAGVVPDQVRFADMNGDGFDDYVVIGTGGRLTVWLNKGQGGDTYDQSIATAGLVPLGQVAKGTGDDPSHIILADMNGDKKSDYVVWRDGNLALDVSFNRGMDTAGGDGWAPLVRYANGIKNLVGPHAVDLADFNCDGKADYLFHDTDGQVTTYLNNGGDAGGKGWIPMGQVAPGTKNANIRFADLNGDGATDYLIIGDNGSITAYLNNGGDPR